MTDDELKSEFEGIIRRACNQHPQDVRDWMADGRSPRDVAILFVQGCPYPDDPLTRRVLEMLRRGDFDSVLAGILGYC